MYDIRLHDADFLKMLITLCVSYADCSRVTRVIVEVTCHSVGCVVITLYVKVSWLKRCLSLDDIFRFQWVDYWLKNVVME
jgi:hypothetical protein